MLSDKNRHKGFTLIEIIIVVVILAIISLVAVPMFSSAASSQVRAAANMIVSDIEYAKSMAITSGVNYSVVFDTTAESYKIVDANSNVIAHPVRIGSDYEFNFAGDSRLSEVDIQSVDFDSLSFVKFNYLGSPDDGGTVTLAAGDYTMVINVENVTGYVSIQ
ncbi:MAG: GspH/FimT family protein [Anaerohalosphaeraceae bacterium]|nr:GspH/FimT family protein [Anaerohalosphaeraceae bacterium]